MADVQLADLESGLLDTFRRAKCNPPCWAVQFPPPIPLVGSAYVPDRGLMVYASAENLSWMHSPKHASDPRWDSFCGETAQVRHQHQYQDHRLQHRRFFPDVGMAPVDNGALLCAAWLALHHCHGTAPASPRGLLRNIAVTNWCKFVVDAPRNLDYAGDPDKLRSSLRLVEIELRVLRPGMVIMPRAILRQKGIGEAMRLASPETRLVGLMQCNARVVNVHLRHLHAKARDLQGLYACTPLAAWMCHVKRMNAHNAWRFLAHLDRELRCGAP